MKTSDIINEIATALAKAQGEFPVIQKNKDGKVQGVSKGSGKEYSFAYKYADIADVIAAVSKVLAANGIAFVQPTEFNSDGMMIATRLIHSSGQWIESEYPVCSVTGDHQKMGGALTYARRYALCSLIGVAAEEDKDGEGAERVPDLPARKQYPARHTETRQSPPREESPKDEIPFQDFDHSEPDQTDAAVYLREGTQAIKDWKGDSASLKNWWAEEAPHRKAAGVINGTSEYADLFAVFSAKGLAIAERTNGGRK